MGNNHAYAILRVKPLRSWAAVAAMARHGRREGSDMAHIDQAKSSLNRYGSDWCDEPHDLRRCMEAVRIHHGARNRKGAPLGSHLLLTASAAYFRPDDPMAMGTWNADRLESWLALNLSWAREKWPGQVAAWRLDLDEATPHLDMFLVPVSQRRTRGGRAVTEVSHRQAFGASRRSFAELQNAYATAMAPLGLVRGRPRSVTGAVHVHPAALRRRMLVEANEQRALRIGVAGLLRQDIWNLKRQPNGALSAEFSRRVPQGARSRFLQLMRPAGNVLVRFERHMTQATKRLVDDMATELVSDTRRDRSEAGELLDEAQALVIEMRRLGALAPAGLEDRIARAAIDLVR